MIRAQSRALALSLISGKCRLNSAMPDSSPPSSQARRIASAEVSSTANMPLQLGPARDTEQSVARITPLSVQLRAFHADMATYHRRMARDHARHGHDGAAVRHEQAA